MTCDKVLSALAAGGFFGRLPARRHAAHCPRCATVINDLKGLVSELSAVPPMTPAERRLWLRACDDVPLVSRFWPRLTRPALAAAVAAVLLVSVGIWLISRSAHLKSSPTVVTVFDSEIVKASALSEVEEMQSGIAALSRELDELQREADLLDARREADALGRQFVAQTAFNEF
jgi:hypothetical protein